MQELERPLGCPTGLSREACSGEWLSCCLASLFRRHCCFWWHSKGNLATLGASQEMSKQGKLKESPEIVQGTKEHGMWPDE